MKTRVLTAVCIAIVGIPLLIFSDSVIFSVALGIFSLMATFELLRALGVYKKYALSLPSYAVSLLLPLFSHRVFVGEEAQDGYLLTVALVFFAYLLYLAAFLVFSGGRISFKDIGAAYMGTLYIAVSFTALSMLRYSDGGVYLFGLVFVAAWVTDTFAYFTGRLFGKHKLAPTVSPKKTVEGSIGGTVFAALAFLLYAFILEKSFALSVSYPMFALSGFLLSVIAQIGDLFASQIKREVGIKDYSNLLPGHGGILDRFDSVLAVSVILFVISKLSLLVA